MSSNGTCLPWTSRLYRRCAVAGVGPDGGSRKLRHCPRRQISDGRNAEESRPFSCSTAFVLHIFHDQRQQLIASPSPFPLLRHRVTYAMLDDDELEEGEIDTRSPPPPYCAADDLDSKGHTEFNNDLAKEGSLRQRASYMLGAGSGQNLVILSTDYMRPWDRGKVKMTRPSTAVRDQTRSDGITVHPSLPKRPSDDLGRHPRSDDLTIREVSAMPRLPPIKISNYCRPKHDDAFTFKPQALATVQTPKHDAFSTQNAVDHDRQDGGAVWQKQQQQQQQSWRSMECKQTTEAVVSRKGWAEDKVGQSGRVSADSAGNGHTKSSSSATSDHHQRLSCESTLTASRRRRERWHRSSKRLGSEGRPARVKRLSLSSRGYSSFLGTKRRAQITRKRRASKTSGQRRGHTCRRSLDKDGDGQAADTSGRCRPHPFVIDRYEEDPTIGIPTSTLLEARKLLAQVKKLTSQPRLLASLGIDVALAERIGAVPGVDECSDDQVSARVEIQRAGDVASRSHLVEPQAERSHETALPSSCRMRKKRKRDSDEEHVQSKRKMGAKLFVAKRSESDTASVSGPASHDDASNQAEPSLLLLRAAALATMSGGRRTMASQHTRAESEPRRVKAGSAALFAKGASPSAADISSVPPQCAASVSALPSMPSAGREWPQPCIYGATGMYSLYSFPWLPYWTRSPPLDSVSKMWPSVQQQAQNQPAVTGSAAAQVAFNSQPGRPVLHDKPVNVPQQLTVAQKQSSGHVEPRAMNLISVRSSPGKAGETSGRPSSHGSLPAGAFCGTQSLPMQETTAQNEPKRRAYRSLVGEVNPTFVIEDVDDCSEEDAANHHASEERLCSNSALQQTIASRNSHEEFARQLAQIRCHLLEATGSRSSPKSSAPLSAPERDGDEDKRLRDRIELLEVEIHRRRSYGSAAPASVT